MEYHRAAAMIGPAPSDGRTCRVNSIHDGDTLRATCGGEKVKVRFYCIDAPETAQRPWGTESRDHLRKIAPATVTLIEKDRDRYGRIVGEIFAGQQSLNLAMVEVGQAAVYRRYCTDRRYTAAEQRAKSARLGIWSKPGDHQQPWAYRRAQRAN